jgi:hypothetical protein
MSAILSRHAWSSGAVRVNRPYHARRVFNGRPYQGDSDFYSYLTPDPLKAELKEQRAFIKAVNDKLELKKAVPVTNREGRGDSPNRLRARGQSSLPEIWTL